MIRRILVGLGGTSYTPVAIQRAVVLAQTHDAELTAVTVLDAKRIRCEGIATRRMTMTKAIAKGDASSDLAERIDSMIETAVYDTKPYDREYLARAASAERIAWRFHDFRLSAEMAPESGHIGGVALDVYEEEEGIFFQDLSGQVLHDDELSHLLIFPNVLITAHQAFLTQEALSEIARVTTENIIKLETREPFLQGTTV